MESSGQFDKLLQAIATHIEAYERREKSRVEKNYGIAMQKSAAVLVEFTATASFVELITTEMCDS